MNIKVCQSCSHFQCNQISRIKQFIYYTANIGHIDLSLVLLLISNLTNGLCLHQFLVTKSAEANKSVKTDANGAH